MCPHCKARVEAVCKAVAGTQDAVVDLKEKTVTVTGSASVETLKKAIETSPGIRLLAQEKFETICSFIFSQNNNIPRIKKSIKTYKIL